MLLLEDLRDGDPIRDDLAAIRAAAQRSAELTRQLLLFSRQQVVTPKVIDLGALLQRMGSMLRRLLGETVRLTIEDEGGARVLVDPGSVEQVVMNLAVNARDAMPHDGTLLLAVTSLVLEDGDARCDTGMSAGPFVELRASDSGTGMTEATRARIFEPFFTTKAVGEGTGLGLSTAFGIVQQSGGSIRVASTLDEGTTFSIYLPRVEAPVDEARAPTTGATRGDETILLVEDEDSLRGVARGILKRAGYAVLEARNGGEALLLCESHHGAIHLLLTDVVMPQLSGPDLAERLRLVRPEMRVLCMSGYTDDGAVQRAVRDGRFAFLQKPITPDSLARKVREVLDGKP